MCSVESPQAVGFRGAVAAQLLGAVRPTTLAQQVAACLRRQRKPQSFHGHSGKHTKTSHVLEVELHLSDRSRCALENNAFFSSHSCSSKLLGILACPMSHADRHTTERVYGLSVFHDKSENECGR